MLSRVLNVYRHNDIKTYNDRIYTINKDLIVYNIGYKVCGTMIYTRPTNIVSNEQQADRGISVITPLPTGEGPGEGPLCAYTNPNSIVNNEQQADRGISVITPLPTGEGTGEGPVVAVGWFSCCCVSCRVGCPSLSSFSDIIHNFFSFRLCLYVFICYLCG